jgi:hypothetical protein
MSRASVVSAAAREIATCLSAWPKLCAKLWKSVTQTDGDDDDIDGERSGDVATSLERLVREDVETPTKSISTTTTNSYNEQSVELLNQCETEMVDLRACLTEFHRSESIVGSSL